MSSNCSLGCVYNKCVRFVGTRCLSSSTSVVSYTETEANPLSIDLAYISSKHSDLHPLSMRISSISNLNADDDDGRSVTTAFFFVSDNGGCMTDDESDDRIDGASDEKLFT